MVETEPPTLSSPLTFDPTSPENLNDPYPMLRLIQQREPLHRSTIGWMVTRYEHATIALRDSRVWGSGMTPERRRSVLGSGPMFEYASRRMNNYNPPEHTRLRSLVTKAFTARRVEALRPRIQEITDDLLNAAKGIREFDVLETLAHPLPCQVICEMVGVPLSDSPKLSNWTAAVHSVLAPVSQPERMPAANDAASEFMAYIRALALVQFESETNSSIVHR